VDQCVEQGLLGRVLGGSILRMPLDGGEPAGRARKVQRLDRAVGGACGDHQAGAGAHHPPEVAEPDVKAIWPYPLGG
jgi:hypothetical protein